MFSGLEDTAGSMHDFISLVSNSSSSSTKILMVKFLLSSNSPYCFTFLTKEKKTNVFFFYTLSYDLIYGLLFLAITFSFSLSELL